MSSQEWLMTAQSYDTTLPFSQVDVAPEQQPAASSLASEASVHKLAELTQAKAAVEQPASNTLCSRSSTLALASNATSSPSGFEDAPSLEASESAVADDAKLGKPCGHMRWHQAALPIHCSCCSPSKLLLSWLCGTPQDTVYSQALQIWVHSLDLVYKVGLLG